MNISKVNFNSQTAWSMKNSLSKTNSPNFGQISLPNKIYLNDHPNYYFPYMGSMEKFISMYPELRDNEEYFQTLQDFTNETLNLKPLYEEYQPKFKKYNGVESVAFSPYQRRNGEQVFNEIMKRYDNDDFSKLNIKIGDENANNSLAGLYIGSKYVCCFTEYLCNNIDSVEHLKALPAKIFSEIEKALRNNLDEALGILDREAKRQQAKTMSAERVKAVADLLKGYNIK